MEDETTEPKIPPLRPLTPEQIDALLGHLPHLEAVARGDFEPGSTGMWGPESVQSEQTRVFFHDLRHGCASLLLAAGVPPRTIMGVLGHSQISLTLNTYSHLSPALEREAADALDRMLVG